MGVVDEAIQDGVSDRGIADVFVPVIDGKLSGHDGGSAAVSVLDDLQEISALWGGHGGKAEIIDDEDFGLEQFFHELWVRAVGSGDGEFLEEARQPDVEGVEAHPAGPVCQSAGQIGFAHPGGAGDDDVLGICDPVTVSQLEDDGLIEASGGFEIDVLDAGIDFEFGVLEETFHASILLPGPLTIHEEGESLFEGEILGVRLLDLVFKASAMPLSFMA